MEGGYMGIKNTRRWGNILAAPQISRVSMRPAILLPGLYPREWKTLGPPKTCTWLFMTVFFFFFFSSCTHGIWKFPGWVGNLTHSSDLGPSCGNSRSLTHCARLGIEPVPHQGLELPWRQCWILHLLHPQQEIHGRIILNS